MRAQSATIFHVPVKLRPPQSPADGSLFFKRPSSKKDEKRSEKSEKKESKDGKKAEGKDEKSDNGASPAQEAARTPEEKKRTSRHPSSFLFTDKATAEFSGQGTPGVLVPPTKGTS